MIASLRRRPPRYHTPRSSPLALRALRRLWALGLTDARIAEILAGLSAEAIRQLDRDGWTIERAEDQAAAVLAAAGAEGLAPSRPGWTRRQVLHHRRRLGLAARSDGLAAARAERDYRRRRFQADRGFGHLLASTDGPRRSSAAASAEGTLRRREVEVLCLLRDVGPMTRRELLGKMGVRQLMARGRSLLTRLVQAGLVQVERRVGRPPLLALGRAARPTLNAGDPPDGGPGDASAADAGDEGPVDLWDVDFAAGPRHFAGRNFRAGKNF